MRSKKKKPSKAKAKAKPKAWRRESVRLYVAPRVQAARAALYGPRSSQGCSGRDGGEVEGHITPLPLALRGAADLTE